MSDPCWMAAQLLADCNQSAQESLKNKPLPESSEVQLQVPERPQPQRSVAWSVGDRSQPVLVANEIQFSTTEPPSRIAARARAVSRPLLLEVEQSAPAASSSTESDPMEVDSSSIPQAQRSAAWTAEPPQSTLSSLSRQTASAIASTRPDARSNTSAGRDSAGDSQLPRWSLTNSMRNYADSLPLWPESPVAKTDDSPSSPTNLPLRPAAEAVMAVAAAPRIEVPRPHSGSQLYQQRWAALRAGQLFTRIAPNSFRDQWQQAAAQPTYQQWRALLAQESKAIQAGQGQNRLTVVVGDSLSLWLPSDMLPRDRFWLNQGISGDTTAGILNRLHFFADTRPTTIHVMAGINDLKNGASDIQVVSNIKDITARLQQQHPQAQIVVHSILPTRWPQLSGDRIRNVNRYLAYTVQQQGAEFLDLQSDFADDQGSLRTDLTSDGLHLNPQGYRLWQRVLTPI